MEHVDDKLKRIKALVAEIDLIPSPCEPLLADLVWRVVLHG